MTDKKLYVGKCGIGVPRVWGDTQELCKKAMRDYTEGHVRNLPLEMWECTEDNIFGGKKL